MEIYWLMGAVVFLILTAGVMFREQRKTRTHAEQLAEFLACKYPPVTPEQQEAGERAVREWEREQYLKEGGREW